MTFFNKSPFQGTSRVPSEIREEANPMNSVGRAGTAVWIQQDQLRAHDRIGDVLLLTSPDGLLKDRIQSRL